MGSAGERAWYQATGGRRIRLLHKRAAILRSIRGFFDELGFLEVQTPSMVPSPGVEPHLVAFEVGGPGTGYLITSPEYQMKRLLVGGLSEIYQLCHCFRGEELGRWHEPEFTMLEWYRANADVRAVMQDTERLLERVTTHVHGHPNLPCGVDVSAPWPQLTVAQAFATHAGVDVTTLLSDEESFFRVLVDRVEPKLGVTQPVWLTEWPAQMASLARLTPGNPSVADRAEAYIAGVELCNGFSELTDPDEQRRRFIDEQASRNKAGAPAYPIDDRFLAALEEGLPPSGGNALGVDRLVMLLLGVDHIEDVTAIPHHRL